MKIFKWKKKWLRKGSITPAISPWKLHCPQNKPVVYQHENKTGDQQCVLFENMTTPQKIKKIKSQPFIQLVQLCCQFNARCQIINQAPSRLFSFCRSNENSSCLWKSFCRVLAPSADSYQRCFNVIIWIEQSSWKQWPILTEQIAFHFSHSWQNRSWVWSLFPFFYSPSVPSVVFCQCCSSSCNIKRLS